MIVVSTGDSIKALRSQFKWLTMDEQKRAISLAFNETMKIGRRKAADAARKRYAVKLGGINSAIKIHRSTRQVLTAEMVVKGGTIPLDKFKARATKKGLTAEVIRGKKSKIKSAFTTNVKAGKKGLRIAAARGRYVSGKGFEFRRKRINPTGPDRPISRLQGPSLPGMFGAGMDKQGQHKQGRGDAVIRVLEKEVLATVPGRLAKYFEKIGGGII